MSGSGARTVAGTGSVNIRGNLEFGNTGITFTSSRPVIFDGSSTQNITGGGTANFNGSLQVNNATANLTLLQDITVQSGITVSAGTLTASNATIDLTGSLTNGGTVTFGTGASLGTLNVSGTTSLLGTATTSLGNLTIGSSGNFTAPSGTLNIAGNFTNSGTFNDGSGTLNFNGTTQQTFSGGSATFNDITISNSTTSGVGLSSTVSLSGTLSLSTAGKLNTNGNLVVLSTGVNSGGRIAELTTPTNFSGTVTIQRFINGPDDWRYLSMPISNGTVASWQSTDFPVTGNFSNPSPPDANVISSSAPSIYYYSASTQAWAAVEGPGLTASAINLPGTVGYSAYSYRTTNITLSVTGSINKSNVSIPLSATSPGWNLVPNPYPSAIDWDNVTKTGLDNSMYIRTGNSTFASYVDGIATDAPFGGWTGEVAIGQSFWVVSNSATTLTLEENDKTDRQYQFLRESEPVNYFRITLASQTQKDEAVVRFLEGATAGMDGQYDARKRKNGCETCASTGYLNISSFTDDPDTDFAISSIPEIACSGMVGLKIEDVPAGEYTLRFSDLDKMYLGYTIKLIDKFNDNTETLIEDGTEYAFSVTADAASKGSSRFELAFTVYLDKPAITAEGLTLTSSSSKGNQWFRDGELLEGKTGATLEVTESGTYSVSVTSGGCEVASDPFDYVVTGTAEQRELGIRVYPNPVFDKLTIELPAELRNKVSRASVFSVTGAETLRIDDRETIDTGLLQFDFSDKRRGGYILTITSLNKIIALRIIKK